MPSAAANRRGIVAMLLAMTLFTANDALVKLAASNLPPGQIMAVRGVFGVAMMLVLTISLGEVRDLKNMFNRTVLLRSAMESVVAILFISSLAHLQLANINAILQATPIILTLIVAVFGIERVGWRRWGAVVVGFAGVLLIVKPSPAGVNVYAVLTLACAALVAVRDLVTSTIRQQVSTPVVTLSAATSVMVLGFLLSAAEDWRPLQGGDYALLASAALVVTLGNLAIVKSFRIAEMSVVMPFRYSMVVIALGAGYAVFGEVPDAVAMLGIVLIVASGLYTLRREHIRKAEAARQEPVVDGPRAA